MKEYNIGDTIRNPSMEEAVELVKHYDGEWIDVGVLLITGKKEESDNDT